MSSDLEHLLEYRGRQVQKVFPGHGEIPFKGKVVKVDTSGKDDEPFRIVYEDGDSEWMGLKELLATMVPANDAEEAAPAAPAPKRGSVGHHAAAPAGAAASAAKAPGPDVAAEVVGAGGKKRGRPSKAAALGAVGGGADGDETNEDAPPTAKQACVLPPSPKALSNFRSAGPRRGLAGSAAAMAAAAAAASVAAAALQRRHDKGKAPDAAGADAAAGAGGGGGDDAAAGPQQQGTPLRPNSNAARMLAAAAAGARSGGAKGGKQGRGAPGCVLADAGEGPRDQQEAEVEQERGKEQERIRPLRPLRPLREFKGVEQQQQKVQQQQQQKAEQGQHRPLSATHDDANAKDQQVSGEAAAAPGQAPAAAAAKAAAEAAAAAKAAAEAAAASAAVALKAARGGEQRRRSRLPRSSPGMAGGDMAFVIVQPKSTQDCNLSEADVGALRARDDPDAVHKAYAAASRAALATAGSMLLQLGAKRAALLTVTVYLRDCEGGATGFNEAWSEWIEGHEPPGVIVLQGSGPIPDVPVTLHMTAYAGPCDAE